MTNAKKQPGSRLSVAIKSGKLSLPEGYTIPEPQEHKDSFTSTREATYRDKEIRIETTYRIIIDEEPSTIHTMVLDDGMVHCHAFPNYAFASAMDLARKIVDASFKKKPCNELSTSGSSHHGGHA